MAPSQLKLGWAVHSRSVLRTVCVNLSSTVEHHGRSEARPPHLPVVVGDGDLVPVLPQVVHQGVPEQDVVLLNVVYK